MSGDKNTIMNGLLRFSRLMCLVILPAALCNSAQCEDAATIAQLEAIGGKITQKEGVITQITFTDCEKLGDTELRAIGNCAHLKNLTLYGGKQKVNDANIGSLTALPELETLGLEGANLSDDGLRQLAKITTLRSLSFFHLSFRKEGFTGVGFEALKDCPKLEKLTVAGMSMGDEGFAAIAKITQLRELSTWHTYQTEQGNAEIAKLPNLVKLQIGQRLPRTGAKAPSLSDVSLPTLASIKTLESLKIGEARFSLNALRQLKALPKLKTLTIYETDIPITDVGTLRAEMPDIKLDFQPLTDEQRKKLESYLKE